MTTRRRPAALATRPLRHERIAELLVADPSASNRSISIQAYSDHKTVGVIRRELEAAGAIPVKMLTTQAHGGALRPPGGPDNDRAVRSGYKSERRVGPLREAELARLLKRFPAEDEDELEIAATRKARMRLLEACIDRYGVHTQRGASAMTEYGKLETSYERQLQRFATNARERGATGQSLEQVLAEITAEADA